jgi:hypothetical protein
MTRLQLSAAESDSEPDEIQIQCNHESDKPAKANNVIQIYTV